MVGAARSMSATLGIEHFSIDTCIIGTIQNIISLQKSTAIVYPGVGQLDIYPESGHFYSAMSEDMLKQFALADPEKLKFTPFDGKRGLSSRSESAKYRNLDELLWHAAFYTSEGRLCEGCEVHDVVKLLHWPNLTRLPLTENTPRILSLFSRHPTSVFFASRLLKVPLSEVCQLYSAAFIAGNVRAVNRKVAGTEPKALKNQSMLSTLIRRLAGK